MQKIIRFAPRVGSCNFRTPGNSDMVIMASKTIAGEEEVIESRLVDDTGTFHHKVVIWFK